MDPIIERAFDRLVEEVSTLKSHLRSVEDRADRLQRLSRFACEERDQVLVEMKNTLDKIRAELKDLIDDANVNWRGLGDSSSAGLVHLQYRMRLETLRSNI
jgi:hypothetical protein